MSCMSFACRGKVKPKLTKPEQTRNPANSQTTMVAAVTSRSQRRSRSRTSCVCRRTSAPLITLVASNSSNALPNSRSPIDLAPFQNLTQGPHAVVDARPHCAEPRVGRVGDLLVAQLFEEPQDQCLPLDGRQRVERG